MKSRNDWRRLRSFGHWDTLRNVYWSYITTSGIARQYRAQCSEGQLNTATNDFQWPTWVANELSYYVAALLLYLEVKL
jgi:hypothetical protein